MRLVYLFPYCRLNIDPAHLEKARAKSKADEHGEELDPGEASKLKTRALGDGSFTVKFSNIPRVFTLSLWHGRPTLETHLGGVIVNRAFVEMPVSCFRVVH